MGTVIDNGQFLKAYAQKDNIHIIKAVAKKYVSLIDTEDLITIGQIALWKAMSKYDEGRGTKFSTYLYYCMINECREWIREHTNKLENMGVSDEFVMEVELDPLITPCLNVLTDEEKYIVEEKVIGNRNLKCISKSIGTSYIQARRKYKAAISKLQTVYNLFGGNKYGNDN